MKLQWLACPDETDVNYSKTPMFKTNEIYDILDIHYIQNSSGIYPKLTNGDAEILLSPHTGVFILNGLGGAGMTLSLGLAEEIVEQVTGGQ